MVVIRFQDAPSKRKAFEVLVGKFPFKSWSSGDMLLPEEALTTLAREDVPFSFQGSSKYEELAPLRDTAAAEA